MLRCLLALLLIVSVTHTAFAQQSTEMVRASTQRSVFDWLPTDGHPVFDHNLDVVTAAEPSIRKSCHVRAITDDTIVCRSNLHHKQTIYRREDILSLIDPPYHGARGEVIITIGLAAAGLAGSFFVPVAWSITLRILTGIGLYGLAWDDGIGQDRNNDLLIYQRSDTPLSVHLRA